MRNDLDTIEPMMISAITTVDRDQMILLCAAVCNGFMPELIEEIKHLRTLTESQSKALDMMERNQL